MPLNYASVDNNASKYATQAQNWLKECKKIAGELNNLYNEAAADPVRLQQIIDFAPNNKNSGRIAKPLHEDPLQSFPAPTLPDRYTLVIADGSQIVPNRHRSLQFGLINIGILVVSFGSGQPPEVNLVSELLEYNEVLREDGNLATEDDIALIRDLRERTLIRDQVTSLLQRPVLTVTDGPLDIFYRSDIQGKKEREAQSKVFQLDQQLQKENILSAGYIDKPGSSMLHNMLDIFVEVQGGAGPEPYKNRISDRLLLGKRIKPGERSAVFEVVSKHRGDPVDRLRVTFFYLNVSTLPEHPWLARVEIPYWISQEPDLVGLIHAALFADAQVLDSHPYPYSLHRAHELAVVKQAEYEEIENMLLSKFSEDSELTGYRSNKDYLKGLK
ncbi:MAG: DNA double-strand break repair nuclease NurA [Anaerolineaceae bacterium]